MTELLEGRWVLAGRRLSLRREVECALKTAKVTSGCADLAIYNVEGGLRYTTI